MSGLTVNCNAPRPSGQTGIPEKTARVRGIPTEISKVIFEKSEFSSPITLYLPSEDDPAQVQKLKTLSLKSPLRSGYLIPAFISNTYFIDEEVLEVFKRHGLANIGKIKITWDGREKWYNPLSYTEAIQPYICRGDSDYPHSFDIRLASRALKSIDYKNEYKSGEWVWGTEVKCLAVTFSYSLKKHFPYYEELPRNIELGVSLPELDRIYEGKAKAFLNPGDGQWKLGSIILEDQWPGSEEFGESESKKLDGSKKSEKPKESTPVVTEPTQGSLEETVINFLTLCSQEKYSEAEKFLGRLCQLEGGSGTWEDEKASLKDYFEDFMMERIEITKKETNTGFGFLFYYEDGSKDKFFLPGDEWLHHPIWGVLDLSSNDEIYRAIRKEIVSKYPQLENLEIWEIEEKDPELWLEIMTDLLEESKKRGVDVEKITEECLFPGLEQYGVEKIKIIKDEWVEVEGIMYLKGKSGSPSLFEHNFTYQLIKINKDWLISFFGAF